MSEVEAEDGLAEQESSLGGRAKKEGVGSAEARSGNMGGIQTGCSPLQGENLSG